MEQKVAKDATAIQSGRDTNIGFTADQVMEAIGKHIPVFGALAREIVDARNADFKADVLRKIAENEARIEAFGNPAFVATLNTAQTNYAKTDDPIVGETLIDLIARRSKETERSRKALTLDQCVEVTGYLTKEEFAALSLHFLFRYTRTNGIADFASFTASLRQSIDPFIDDVSREDSAYSYLEAHRCASISIGSVDLFTILSNSYSAFITKGFEKDEVKGRLSDLPKHLITPCMFDATKFQLEGQNDEVFRTAAQHSGVPEALILTAIEINRSALMTFDEVKNLLRNQVPNFVRLCDLWENTPLKSMSLTPIGMAIGYSNAARLAGFTADLSIWIK